MVIWKYKLHLTEFQEVSMPQGAKILSVQVQDDQICFWVILKDEAYAKYEEKQFLIVGTGTAMPTDMQGWQYIATVQIRPFVWHVFVFNAKPLTGGQASW